jgi:ATP-dependent exoDNAse (exonuclease V) beta subunit|tara:strand:+ start:117 stop:908 length:792 start_codon:yes stop_codon:yes gene_type:complete
MKKHISYSELKTWDECAYKHKLVYIDNIKKFLGNEHTSFGTAVHEVCEKSVLGEISLDSNSLNECFDQKFLEEIKKLSEQNVELDKQLLKDMRAQSRTLLDHIIPELKSHFDWYEVVAAEEQLYEPVEDSKKLYKGFIDLVLKTKDGRYHIIDWKTCSWGWDSKRKNERITSYQLAYYKHFYSKKHNIDPADIDTHFALLKRTAKKNKVEIFKVTSGNKKIENSLKLLNKAVYNIENGNFVKNRLSCTSKFGCEFFNTKHCSR